MRRLRVRTSGQRGLEEQLDSMQLKRSNRQRSHPSMKTASMTTMSRDDDGGDVHTTSRISNRTGGFEGSPVGSSSYHVTTSDDSMMVIDSTFHKSFTGLSEEPADKHSRRNRRHSDHRSSPRRDRKSEKDGSRSSQRGGLFRRWALVSPTNKRLTRSMPSLKSEEKRVSRSLLRKHRSDPGRMPRYTRDACRMTQIAERTDESFANSDTSFQTPGAVCGSLDEHLATTPIRSNSSPTLVSPDAATARSSSRPLSSGQKTASSSRTVVHQHSGITSPGVETTGTQSTVHWSFMHENSGIRSPGVETMGTQSTVHWSFMHDNEGQGFELGSIRDPPPPVSPSCDDSTVGSWLDGAGKLNMNDEDLMDDSSSPGALRLTADGLKRHEKRAFQQSMRQRSSDTFDEWKKRREQEKWRRANDDEQEGQLFDQTTPMQVASAAGDSSFASKRLRLPRERKTSESKQQHGLIGCLSSFRRKEEDVTDVSLAPLRALPDAKSRVSDVSSCKRFPLLGRKHNIVQTAQQILQKERAAALEARERRKILEKREKERIDRMRAHYLEQQRSREAAVPQPPSPNQRSSIFTSMELEEEEGNGPLRPVSTGSPSKRKLSSAQKDSTSKAALPPCVVCKEGERTHIAAPCMHLSFCQKCAARLTRRNAPCYVCSQPGVTFAEVSV